GGDQGGLAPRVAGRRAAVPPEPRPGPGAATAGLRSAPTDTDTMPPVRTVAEIVAEMAARTRPENAAGWDPVGLQLGDPKAGVERVAVCHEVTEAVVARVEEEGPDLL